ncbi:MAG: MFS transporter [Oscillospiraceae bacterium]|nr:MFS transporter [Oscillospiraceae bacterium]
MPTEKKKLDYKWIILVLCVMMNFVCLGFCSSNKGIYLAAITDALGIKRSLFAINDSCRFIASAVVNLFFGALIVKVGIRKMTGIGFVCTALAMVLYAVAENVLVFYIGGTFLGIGLAFTTTSITGTIVRRWFHKDIGKYTGIVFASNGVGAALASQIASPMIHQEGNPFGYRQAYWVVVAIVVVTGILVVALLREEPKESLTASAAVNSKRRGTDWYGIDFCAARKKTYFYLAAAVVLISGVCLQGISSVYIAHLTDIGMRPEFTAALASLFALLLTASKLLVGWMYDRFGISTVMVVCPLAAVIALVLLAILGATPGGMALAVLFAVLFAVSMPLETLVIPLLVNDLFGSVAFDKMLGIFSAINYVGYALGAPVANLSYDISGSYKFALLLSSVFMLLGCLAFRFVLKEVARMKIQQQVKEN